MKTIIARFTELKENIAGTEESEFDDLDVNKVDKALKTIGVQLKDTTGQIRDMDDVFLEVSSKWSTLDRNSQRYIATIAAGSRQQSRFIAMMDNYERTVELIDAAYESTGKSSQQFAKYTDTVEFKLKQLSTTWEQFRISFASSDTYSGAIEMLTHLIEKIDEFKVFDFVKLGAVWLIFGKVAIENFIKGVQSAIGGLGRVFNNIFAQTTARLHNTLAKSSIGKKLGMSEFNLISTEDAKAKIDELKAKIQSLDDEKLQIKISTAEAQARLNRFEQEIQKLNAKLANPAITESQRKIYTDRLARLEYIRNNGTSARLLGGIDKEKALSEQEIADIKRQERQSREAQMRGQAIGQAFAVGLTSAITSYMMSNNPMDVFKSIMYSSIISFIPIVVNTVIAAGTAVDKALMATKTGLILMGIATVIAGITAGVKALVKWTEEQAKEQATANSTFYATTQVLEKLEEKQEKLNQTLDEANKKYDEAKNSLTEITDAKDKFEEYADKIAYTTEEAEEFTNVQNEIAENFPELIDYYDEEGNAILESIGSAWDTVLQKKKAYYAEAAEEQAEAEFEANYGNFLIATAENEREKAFGEETSGGFIEGLLQFGNPNSAGKDTGLFGGNEIYFDEEKKQWILGDTVYIPEEALEGEHSEYTIVQALDSLADSQKEEVGDILSEIFQRSTFGQDLNLTSTGGQLIEDLMDFLKEGDEKQEKSNRDKFQKALKAGLSTDTAETEKNLTASEEALKESMNNLVTARLTTTEDYESSSKNVQRLMESFIAKELKLNPEDFKTEFENSPLYNEKWYDENGKILNEYWEEATSAMQQFASDYADGKGLDIESISSTIGETFDENTKQIIDSYYKYLDSAAPNLLERINKINGLNIDDGIKTDMTELEKDNIDNYNRMMEDMADFYNATLSTDANGIQGADSLDWFAGLSDVAQQKLHDTMVKIPEIFKQDYAMAIQQMGQSVDSDILSQLFSVDLSDADVTNIDAKKEEFIKMVQEMPEGVSMSVEEIEAIWDSFIQYSENAGAVDFSVGVTGITSIEEKVTEQLSKTVDSYNKAAKFIEESISEQGLDFSSYNELSEILDEVNLKVEDYTSLMSNGKFDLNYAAMEDAYLAQIDDTEVIIDNIKRQVENEIASIDAILAQSDSLNLANDQYTDLIPNSANYAQNLWSAAAAMASITGANPDAVFAKANSLVEESVQLAENQSEFTQRLIKKREDLQKLLEDDTELRRMAQMEMASEAEIRNSTTEAVNKGTEAMNKASGSAEDLAEKEEALAEAQKELNEALYGTELYENASDHLYNYTTRIEDLAEAANRAKDSLSDLNREVSLGDALNDYISNARQENITREAENRIIQQSIDNYKKILDDNYAQYYKQIGDKFYWNASIVDAQINDQEKEYVTSTIEQINELQDTLDDNLDEMKKREQEFRDLQKEALDSRIELEDKVVEVLEQKYEEEIEQTQEKYDALKEADDDYLSALEEAINKQRELRDRANNFEDLAQKERKLALKTRDTSGTNRAEVLGLQQEIEEQREQVLDSEVDRILDSMREMYELQQESRDAEIEYMEAMKENGVLIQEANAIIDSFNSREDMLAWFFENNKELADMSVAATEKYKMELEEMYDAAELYYEVNKLSLEDLTSFTEEEVALTMDEIGQTLTDEANRSFLQMREEVDEAVKDAMKAVEDAANALAEASNAVSNAAVGLGDLHDSEPSNGYIKSDYSTLQAQYYEARRTGNTQAAEAISKAAEQQGIQLKQPKNYSQKSFKKSNSPMQNVLNSARNQSKVLSARGGVGQEEMLKGMLRSKVLVPMNTTDTSFIGPIQPSPSLPYYFKLNGEYYYAKTPQTILNILGASGRTEDDLATFARIYKQYGIKHLKNGKYSSYKSGGLVNYTGPAWVDGTPNKPEAFLNSDDTRRIGEAAKLLANLPILNSTANANTELSSNIGDTTIEIHINVDKITSDYDVDSMIERVKQEIVDISHPTGSPVILRK